MLKSKKSRSWFSCSFFLPAPNNCSFPAGGPTTGTIVQLPTAALLSPVGFTTGTIVRSQVWTAGGGSPDPEAPRTIVRYPAPDKPDPDPIHRGVTCLKPNNSPITPRSPRYSSRSEQLFGLRAYTLSK